MSRPMTFQELVNVMKHIAANNSPFSSRRGPDGRMLPVVKYAHPSLDFRTNTCFAITFRGFAPERVFHTQNECRDLPKSLHDRVMEYLTASEPIEVETRPVPEERNQCDGCARGLPLENGLHRGQSSWDVQGCTAERYL